MKRFIGIMIILMIFLSGCNNYSKESTKDELTPSISALSESRPSESTPSTSTLITETTANKGSIKGDLITPTLELNGAEEVEVSIGELYIEEGANAIDSVDGTLYVDIQDNIEYLKKGKYEITYTAHDKEGNSVQKKRIIIVKPIELSTEGGITTTINAIETTIESNRENVVLAFDLTIANNSNETIQVPPMFIFENNDFDEHELNGKITTYFPVNELKKGESISEQLQFAYEGNKEDLINSQSIKFNYSKDGRYSEFPYEITIRIADFVSDTR